TTKPTVKWVGETAPDRPRSFPAVNERTEVTPAVPTDPPLFAAIWADWYHGGNPLLWSVKSLAAEVVKAFAYVLWLPALLGLWWFRGRLRSVPGAWAPILVSAAIVLLMWRVARVMGYVSDRHLLLPVLFGSFWAVAGLQELVRRLADRTARGRVLPRVSHRTAAAGVLLAVTATGLVKSMETLHADRAGFRSAGLWLAERALPGDDVLDPYCWAHYYAGQVFLEGVTPLVPAGHRPVRYVVLEESGHEHIRLPMVDEARAL